MPSVHEILTEQFHRWELRGRGWQVFDEPVYPEPPFRPFDGHYLPDTPTVDDGHRPTFLSSMVQRLGRKLSTEPELASAVLPDESEPEPEPLVRDSLIELQTSLPANLNISTEAFPGFLANLPFCREPIAFELLGVPNRVTAQFVAARNDTPSVRRQLQAYFPEAIFQTREGGLVDAWNACNGEDARAIEFGLEREFMYPLASGKLDPFIGIVGALAELQKDELALFQVLFQPTRYPWADSILRSVTGADDKPFFLNAKELTEAANNKVSRALYAAVVRILVRADHPDRTLQIACDLAGSLRVFAHPQGNELIPLTNDDYPFDEHIEDVILRQSRRSGILLNSDELIGFVHLPSSAVRSTVLQRDAGKTKAAPSIAGQLSGLLLGYNVHAGESIPVRLDIEQRVRHTHVIGASGTGKSTLLFNLIRQDIDNGDGVALLDPHGDLVDKVLGIIPPSRIQDVILIDPADEQYSVGFNILSAHSDLEKNLLASDLVAIFQRLSSSWGDQMGSVLQNAILAFLESDQGGTLADLRRFLIEPAYRDTFLKTVRDPDIVYYWRKTFTQLSGNKSVGPVLTRLGTFLSPKPIRYMVSQPVNRLDFREILDSGKIFLAKLSQGQIGKENAFLLGSLLVAKFQQLVMGRQAQQVESRRPYWLYVDEFQDFSTPSMAEILSGARKYRLGLTLAHQELHQLDRVKEVATAVLSQPYTRIVFRVGDADARALENGLSFFKARDLQNLETGQAICRMEKADCDFNLAIPYSEDSALANAKATRQAVVSASRARYATPRAEVEAALQAKRDADPEPAKQQSVTPRVHISEANCAEVPKIPVSEKEMVAVSPPKPAEKSSAVVTPAVPPDLGRGGAQHQAIQQRIKQAADALGFRSVIEKEVLDGRGSVDLLLERGNEAIACEISILTTIDHEIRNITKCLKAGFPKVAVICLDEERLRKITAAVGGSLGAEVAKRVAYYQPDEFICHLKTAASASPLKTDQSEVRRGYKIKRVQVTLPPEERKAREDAAMKAITDAMRRKPKRRSD